MNEVNIPKGKEHKPKQHNTIHQGMPEILIEILKTKQKSMHAGNSYSNTD